MVVLMPRVQAVVISDMWKNACGRSALLSKFSESVQTGTAYYWPASQFPPKIHRQLIQIDAVLPALPTRRSNGAGTSVKALEAIERLGNQGAPSQAWKKWKTVVALAVWRLLISKTYREKQ